MIRILALLDSIIDETSRDTKLSDDKIRQCFFKMATALKFLAQKIAAEENDHK